MTWSTCECQDCTCENPAKAEGAEAICAECRQGDHAYELEDDR